MGSPLLRKKLLHPRRFLDPTVVHWDLTSSRDDFPIGQRFAAVCLCEVSAFRLSLHSPARGAKDAFLLGAPGCNTYKQPGMCLGFFPHLVARSFDTLGTALSFESPGPSLL